MLKNKVGSRLILCYATKAKQGELQHLINTVTDKEEINLE